MSIFITQFMGAFNDNIFRAAMSGFVTYKLTTMVPEHKQIIVTLAVGLFMLPFFLFSATAGEMADKFRKDMIFKVLKVVEVVIAAFAIAGFWVGSPHMLLAVLFFMGTQSAFFGPAKYSVLPDVLKKDELIAGNGLFEAGTYLAILEGLIIGGLLMSGAGDGIVATALCVSSVATVGLISSLCIPKIPAAEPKLRLTRNFLKLTWKNMKFATVKREVFLCIMGLSWFWLLGAVLISQIPGLAQEVLNGSGGVYTFLLTVFSCGIGLGAIVCQLLLKGEISSRYLPLSALLMAVFLGDLAWTTLGIVPSSEVRTFSEFITSFTGIRISLDLLMVAFSGGLFMVPLNTMLQVFTSGKIRSRVIATNNIVNALFMVMGSVVCIVLLSVGVKIGGIFAILAVANALVAVYICGLLPEHLVRSFGKKLFKLMYGVEVVGLENYKSLKGKAVIVSNHQSFLDPAILWLYLPGVTFAINTNIAKKGWIRPFLRLAKYVTVDPTNPMGVKKLTETVRLGRKVVIYPEGRMTTTGGLMKVYPGPAIIADKSNAPVLPISIEGAQYTAFSRFAGKFRKSPKSRIKMTIFPARKLDISEKLEGKERRDAATEKLYEMLAFVRYAGENKERTLLEELLMAEKRAGTKKAILEDVSRKPLTFKNLKISVLALANELSPKRKNETYTGLMLPNSTATVIAFFAMQARGLVPAMLDPAKSAEEIKTCCKTAELKTVYTSSLWVRRAGLQKTIEALEKSGVTVVYLEDLQKKIGGKDKLSAWMKSRKLHKYIVPLDSENPAVLCFAENGETAFAFSHREIQEGRQRILAVSDIGLTDIFFNAMPMSEIFGLVTGMLLPVLSGIKTVFYPVVTHYTVVPELIYDTNATIIVGTPDVLCEYGKEAHPYDFHAVRYVIASSNVPDERTDKQWLDRFGIRVYEGRGGPDIAGLQSLNLPMFFKKGTLGKPLPGVVMEEKSLTLDADGFLKNK